MAGSVGVNKLSIVSSATNGVTSAFPDVCKTPTSGGPIPIPYPNVARSSDAARCAKRITADGQAVCKGDSAFSTSTGDEPGSVGGVISGKTRGEAAFVNFSFDVTFEGKGAARAFDLMLHNDKNTPPFPLVQGPVVAIGKESDVPRCPICKEPL